MKQLTAALCSSVSDKPNRVDRPRDPRSGSVDEFHHKETQTLIIPKRATEVLAPLLAPDCISLFHCPVTSIPKTFPPPILCRSRVSLALISARLTEMKHDAASAAASFHPSCLFFCNRTLAGCLSAEHYCPTVDSHT